MTENNDNQRAADAPFTETINDNAENRQQGPVAAHRRELSWGVYLASATLVLTLLTFSHGTYMDVVDRISALDRIVATNTTAHLKRDTQVEHMESRFVRLEDTLGRCSEQLSELRALSR
ncbi:MAG: hypothetical protein K9L88_11315 [Chromatiaceae bacterium]|nr:hypothetical protein [Chromatiaceae bacterium]